MHTLPIRLNTAAMLAVACGAALCSVPAAATDILARVVSSTPVVQQVVVPRQVCNNVQVLMQAPTSGAGAMVGALAGGAAGNAVGNGSGRAAATMLGLVGGAIVGERIESPGPQTRNVQQCGTQTVYENRASHYNVVYEYQRTQYNVQLAQDPGLYVRLRVTPVDGLAATPQVLHAPAPVQQAYGGPAPMYVQPAPYPVYYPRPYYAPVYAPVYAPFYAPIGLSLNFGYVRGHRHRHHH